MIRLSRLTPELRAALASRQFAPSSALWAEAGTLGLAALPVAKPGERLPRWSLTAEGREVRAYLLDAVKAAA